MPALPSFTDFMKITPAVYLSGPQHVINEAQERTYLLGRFLKGRGLEEVLQGGSKIKETLMFDDASTAVDYHPNDQFSWSNPQVLTNIEMPWRFTADHMAWNEETQELNVPDGLGTAKTRALYKAEKRKIEQRMWTSLLNKMERDLFASPHGQSGEMESDSGKKTFSIPVFITEDTDNFHPGGSTGANAGTGTWTTVETVNPATEAKWRNQVDRYDLADPDDSDGDSDGLFDAFDRMYLKLGFQAPPTRKEYFENPSMARMFIACSLKGQALFRKLCRESNDRFARTNNDPAYLNPAYGGIELVYVSTLDTAPLYFEAGASTWVAEDNSGLGSSWSSATSDWPIGPRFYWINGNYIKPIFHTRKYFSVKEPFNPPNQPTSFVQFVNCYRNLVCTSRQRQGIVAPGA